MKVLPTGLPEVLIVEPRVFSDDRGFFMESYSERSFNDAVGERVVFVQDNQSRSSQGVLRGLHYQLPPHAQGKLVRVISGRIFDVAVDMRRSSPWFGRWTSVELSDQNHRQLWIPAGFAHGFLVLSEIADVLYKTTAFFEPSAEAHLRWNDSRLAIDWPAAVSALRISSKDAAAPGLDSAALF